MNLLKKVYHIVIKHDVVTPLYVSKFEHFGNGSVLYRPLTIQGKNNVYIGDNTTILAGARIQIYNDKTGLKGKVKIGNNCYFGYNISFLAGEDIIVDDGVLMASNILISSENHSTNPEDKEYYMNQSLNCKPVHIGEGTWIGERTCVLPGVDIGKKCVIGAGSVVTKSIPDYSIVAGSPAKVIKKYNFEIHRWTKVEE